MEVERRCRQLESLRAWRARKSDDQKEDENEEEKKSLIINMVAGSRMVLGNDTDKRSGRVCGRQRNEVRGGPLSTTAKWSRLSASKTLSAKRRESVQRLSPASKSC